MSNTNKGLYPNFIILRIAYKGHVQTFTLLKNKFFLEINIYTGAYLGARFAIMIEWSVDSGSMFGLRRSFSSNIRKILVRYVTEELNFFK